MKASIDTGRRVATVALLAATAALAATPAAGATKILEGIVGHGALQWPEYVSAESGCLKSKDVEVDMILTRGVTGGAQELAAGSLNIAGSGFPDFFRAIGKGAPVRIFISAVGVPPYGVYAKPEIKKVADLKGKTISIGGAKDVTLIYIEAMLNPGGVTSKDVSYVYAKSTVNRLAALMSGGADAAILYPPTTFKAAAQGYTFLGNIEPFLKDFPFTVLAANIDWAKANRQAMLGYVGCYGKSVRWLYDGANKPKAVELLIKYAKVDPGDADKIYDYFFKELKAFAPTGLISEPAYKKMIDALVSFEELTQPVPPREAFVDESFVKEAWNESK
jgi:ABC-type nitrate/sulfonate/bicarbonate transport system substrate-binding protein